MFLSLLAATSAIGASYAFVGSWPTQGPPLGLTIDGDGTVLVSTPIASPPLFRHAADGTLLAQFGFAGPMDVYGIASTRTGHIFYAAHASGRVWHISSSGADLGGWGRSICCFRHMALDDAWNVYITNWYDNLVHKYASFDRYGDYPVAWPSPRPSGVVYGGGYVNVASLDDGTIRKYLVDGTPASSFETGADGVEALAFGRDNRFYLVDKGRSRILVFSEQGAFIDSIGNSPPGYAHAPTQYVGVAVADDGTIFAGDHAHGRVLKFAPSATAVRASSWGRIKALYR